MQLGLIVGILCSIAAVIFAMQNIAAVTVTLGFWTFDGSLALVLLVALGLGALIAGLVSSPAMIRRQWNIAQLSRQAADLERKLADEVRRNEELRRELSDLRNSIAGTAPIPAASEEKPYVGLRVLLAGDAESKSPPT